MHTEIDSKKNTVQSQLPSNSAQQQKQPQQLVQPQEQQILNENDSNQFDLIKLKTELSKKIATSLKSHGANQLIITEFERDVDKYVIISIQETGVSGLIRCIICVDEKNKKITPKKVYCKCDKIEPYWVTSNFSTHLQNVHRLNFQAANTKREKNVAQCSDSSEIDANTNSTMQIVFPDLSETR